MRINQATVHQLQDNDPTLTVLFFHEVELNDNLEPDFNLIISLARALTDNTTVREMRAGLNNMGDQCVFELANALLVNKTLQVLDLSGNNITDEGAKRLASSLLVNKTLKVLNLSENHITDEGACKLAALLEQHPALEINVSDNRIGDRGLSALANALKENTHLKVLDLSGNLMTQSGLTSLTNLLEVNKTITTLKVSLPDVLQGDIFSSFEKFIKKINVTDLELVMDNISFSVIEQIAEMIKINRTLRHFEVYFRSERRDATIDAMIENALASNFTITKLDVTKQTENGGVIHNDSLCQTPAIESMLVRNKNCLFIEKLIHTAWVSSVPDYSNDNKAANVAAIKGKLSDNVPCIIDDMIVSILELRLSKSQNDAGLINEVLDKLFPLYRLLGIDHKRLPEDHYLNEFSRFLNAKREARQVTDFKSLYNALASLKQKFSDPQLNQEAIGELIGLLGNDYFASLDESLAERTKLDKVILAFSAMYPHERDLIYLAVSPLGRLQGRSPLAPQGMYVKTQDLALVQAERDAVLEQLYKECNVESLEALINSLLGLVHPEVDERCKPTLGS